MSVSIAGSSMKTKPSRKCEHSRAMRGKTAGALGLGTSDCDVLTPTTELLI